MTCKLENHSHYYKSVVGLNGIDIYRILILFEVTDPCIQHAIKKLLVAGKRGYKDQYKDINEAIASLSRWQDIYIEDKQRM